MVSDCPSPLTPRPSSFLACSRQRPRTGPRRAVDPSSRDYPRAARATAGDGKREQRPSSTRARLLLSSTRGFLRGARRTRNSGAFPPGRDDAIRLGPRARAGEPSQGEAFGSRLFVVPESSLVPPQVPHQRFAAGAGVRLVVYPRVSYFARASQSPRFRRRGRSSAARHTL